MSSGYMSQFWQAYPYHNSIPKLTMTTVILIALGDVYEIIFIAGATKYLLSHVQQFLWQYFQPCFS